MDINSLLSPADAPSSHESTASPRSALRHDSPAVRQSPRSKPSSSMPLTSPPRHVAMHHRPPMPSPPGSNFSANTLASNFSAQSYHNQPSTGTPPIDQRPPMLRASTSGMDTLADLASMQQYHQHSPRRQTITQKSEDRNGHQQRPRLEEIQRQKSGSRSSIDMSKLETPKPQPPPRRILRSESLTDAELQEAVQLFKYLVENPHDYTSHLTLTRLLRRGLRAHALTTASNEIKQDPRTYELVAEILEANEAMSARFAIGEELWQERMQDQQLLAFTVEECMAVIELYEKAVYQEAGSTAIWRSFGNWALMLYQAGHGIEADMPLAFRDRWTSWSEDDKMVAREAFPRQLVVDTWKRGAQETMHNIDDSHLIWDNWITLVLEDLERSIPGSPSVAEVRELFQKRLNTPHREWDSTFQQFSQFVSKFFDSAKYEDTMTWTKHLTQQAPQRYEARSTYEMKWRSARQANEPNLEWMVVEEYLDFELGQGRKNKKKAFSFDLSKALFQRALLRFPHNTTLWEDFFLFLADELPEGPRGQHTLPAIDRGTSHCPWSGTLWGHYIRAGELEGLSFEEMSHIKHRATSKGLLDASPTEEHVIINTNWCTYLRRRAFAQRVVDEDELDVTEVGIRSALEEADILGKKKEGDDYKGDPLYRLERIYLRFCTQVGDGAHLQTARSIWRKLIPRCGHSYEFWQWYFLWERFNWVRNPSNVSTTPKLATEVLKQGISHPTTDWPEKLIEDLQRHAEDYEDPAGQLFVIIASRKARKEIVKRRAAEHEAQQAALKQAQDDLEASREAEIASGKRKRETPEEAFDNAFKRMKPDPEGNSEISGVHDSTVSQQKRDRENATVIVRNLPLAVHGRRVRNFFRDCGDIKDFHVTRNKYSTIATIEFENGEDVLAALTRNGREVEDFEGRRIEVVSGTGLTIWCANYPAAADEAYIRGLFDKFGQITDIRFPSLKYNTHRRFCYIQFREPGQAQAAASALDGTRIQEGDTEHELIAKISDPSHKQDRSGALEEGRELYIKDLDWTATEDEVKEIFSKYGQIQSVRIPRNMAGKSKGHAFVVFLDPDRAEAALELNKTKFKSRFLDVSIAENKAVKRSATTVVRDRVSASPSPSVTNGSTPAMRAGSETSAAGTTTREEIAARTIALLDVPDTVNDARVRAIAEPHGSLAKIILRPDHGGAIVEYADVAAAGKASLALEGLEIVPGREIRIGTVAELMGAKAERKPKDDRVSGAKVVGREKKDAGPAKAPFGGTSGVVRRPGQQAGRRGGLGVKRGGGAFVAPRAANADGAEAKTKGKDGESHSQNGDAMDIESASPATANGVVAEEDKKKKKTPKSNADFKAMFLKGKE